jgi:hypothetical protein
VTIKKTTLSLASRLEVGAQPLFRKWQVLPAALGIHWSMISCSFIGSD